MSYAAVATDHPVAWHQERFIEFGSLKQQLGEPTPHMNVAMKMTALDGMTDRTELAWRAGCYAVGYSLITAEALWREWPWERFLREGADHFGDWLNDNWAGIHTRTPRRVVRTQHAFQECLHDYASWALVTMPLLRYDAPYDVWWESANTIRFMGRYIVIRLLELLRRWDFMSAELYDIRAMGAESPVRCLSLLVPDQLRGPVLSGDKETVDMAARSVLATQPPEVNFFRFAALLCEWRKAYENQGDYPGNQTDEELGYATSKYAKHWQERGLQTRLWEARATLVPDHARGEVHGWTGQRKFAAACVRRFGVNWSDARFDYHASVAADKPVAR